MTTPTSAGAGPALTSRLAWRARHRPEPGFAHVLAAGAGVFSVIAVVGLVTEISSDDPMAPGILLDLALAVGAFVLALRLPGPIRSLATTVLVLTVPIIWFFAFFGSGGGDTDSTRGALLLSVAAYLVLYLAGWTKGRAVFLAFALTFFASWVLFEVGGTNDSTSLVPFQSQISTQTELLGSGGSGTDTEIVALVIGLAFLGVGGLLDRRRLAGAATPFIAVGAVFAILGATALGSNESAVGGGLLAAAIGAVVGIIGGLGKDRRGSTWIGVIVTVLGLLAVIVDLAGDDTLGLVGLAALVALALTVAAVVLAPRLHEHVDGDRSD